jgi:hypothetical protein
MVHTSQELGDAVQPLTLVSWWHSSPNGPTTALSRMLCAVGTRDTRPAVHAYAAAVVVAAVVLGLRCTKLQLCCVACACTKSPGNCDAKRAVQFGHTSDTPVHTPANNAIIHQMHCMLQQRLLGAFAIDQIR